MLFCTSLVALVGAGEQPAFSPRRLQITNTKRQTTICELSFSSSILAVKLNRRRLIVVLETTIYIYDISNMKLLHDIHTSPNPNAICALSPSNENCYIAYPSPTPSPSSPFSSNAQNASPSGDVYLFDAASLQVVNIVQAHKSPVAYVAINSDGSLLATASDKGTVIRVFSIPNAQKLYQFRRGSYPTRIHSISFNVMSTLLCVSSDTDTVHIFKLGGVPGSAGSSAGNGTSNNGTGSANIARHSAGQTPITGYEAFIDDKKKSGIVKSTIRRSSLHLGRTVAGSVGNYLPDALTEMWEPTRDFAYLKLPTSGVQSVVALSNNIPQVMVVTSEGYLYQYNIDLENGGECLLLKQYSFMEPNEEFGNIPLPSE
ncbi:4617_t:CDS:2 [Paraglomus brasilianum]|uniref:4617_t:CDS:1 n=1 Tax=Paraglomus brasilianum TaxID=144538 RepID=A0A9N9FTU5_9GLOM|nr:4617_t:CDS:2 [Paraglomus brasilianum]